MFFNQNIYTCQSKKSLLIEIISNLICELLPSYDNLAISMCLTKMMSAECKLLTKYSMPTRTLFLNFRKPLFAAPERNVKIFFLHSHFMEEYKNN